MMSSEFEMTNIGELNYFLGLQIKAQQKGRILLNQSKYIHDLLKCFKMNPTKKINLPPNGAFHLN
ncbi:hypothetical protein Pint_11447 [Pistacia integerrima]|uniref:Uncharacterized protein n=1 Tax=Pistacia integerrima TaxID=434235 RepID=A0ACC0XMM0_9ROSI|nr:hypothetical protein Pint_11447 [Pistacia integerrima]